jgi:hypothetical protein
MEVWKAEIWHGLPVLAARCDGRSVSVDVGGYNEGIGFAKFEMA